jgi:cobalt-zinc-cadmium efflux system protein
MEMKIPLKLNQLTRLARLKIVLFLNSAYLIAASITVVTTGSLALFSEAGHMLADVGGIALAMYAVNYAQKSATPQRTFGYYRMEILASLLNSLILVLLSIYILYEGFRRIFEPPEIPGLPLILIAMVGVVVNFIGMRLLSHSAGHRHMHGSLPYRNNLESEDLQNLNVRAVYLESLSDTLGSAGVLAAGVIMLTTKFYLADPLISIGLALFMIPRTWSIIKKAVDILMEGVPANLSHEEVKKAVLQIKGVTGVFELHIWTITSGMNALSAHVVIIDPTKSQLILQEINSILEKKFKITHATIQIERYHQDSGAY